MKKNKILASALAVTLAVVLLFGGTLAWQSISQTALNEVAASVNPGGRLHDDFNNITTEGSDTMEFDKDVYVENFTDLASNGVQVYARVRLDEYMELGTGAGVEGDGTKYASGGVKPLVAGATMEDKSSWSTYLYGEDSPFRTYWDMTFGGSTVYMPTFNKNKDSLEADINGSFQGKNGTAFDDHVDYALDDGSGELDGQYIAIYDKDAAANGEEETDELVNAGISAGQIIEKEDLTAAENFLTSDIWGNDAWKQHVELKDETHTAKSTLNGEVMTMERYIARLASTAEGNDDFTGTGDFWVYDTDGWAYWADPIDPATATGLLLNGISRTEKIINQDWYYAINVVAQFVTGDDLGSKDDKTGFYDITQGSEPSTDALKLLSNIGVQINHSVGTADELAAALELGGIINVTGDIELSAPLTASASCVLDLGENTISGENVWNEDARNWSLLSVRNGATVVINGGTFAAAANDSYAVDVRDGSKVVINNGEFKGNMECVYVLEGEAVIYGGTFSIQQTSGVEGKEYDYVLNCNDANYQNGTAKITVCGGSFEKFDPANCAAEGEGTSFVANGYTSSTEDSGATYTVTKNTVSTGE